MIVDLAPSDSGWMELVKDLTNAGISVLVTVREEDFHRAGIASRDVPLGEVGLDSVTRNEAKDIYDSLVRLGTPSPHVDFDEAWWRFTTGEVGPLLEFTHIVTEGQTLAKKIEGQVARLQLTEPALRLEVLKLRRRVQKLAALLRLALVLLRVSGFTLSGERLPDGPDKLRILRALDQARACIPLRALLRLLRLSPSRFHAWRRRHTVCALDDQSSCPHTSPRRSRP